MADTRGKVPRITETEYLILRMLATGGRGREMYGLEMVEQSGGEVKRGTVYVLLSRLQEKGYVRSRIETGDSVIPRRLYKLTGLGAQVYDVWSRLQELGELQVAPT